MNGRRSLADSISLLSLVGTVRADNPPPPSPPRTVPRTLAIRRLRTWSTDSGFAPVALGLAVISAALAALAPRAFSIATVFLFAGPHNWMEARYFLTRLPGRWGPLRGYFLLGLFGALLLGAGSALLPWIGSRLDWDRPSWVVALASWETALVGWVLALIRIRSRQKPMRDWSIAWPIGFAAIALAWVAPAWWGLGLVYGHPLMAFAILDRELKRSRPAWQAGYRLALLAVPGLLLLVVWLLSSAADLAGDDPITTRIARHAGSDLLAGVSSHLLVATHTFLEMLHYGVWLVAIPLASLRVAPWRVSTIPIARNSRRWRIILPIALGVGLVAVVLLWVAFLADYPMTRDVYFTVALLHVLAEIPLLLRMI